MNIDRIEEIQSETACLDSVSVQQALLKVWNETQQSLDKENKSLAIKLQLREIQGDILQNRVEDGEAQIKTLKSKVAELKGACKGEKTTS